MVKLKCVAREDWGGLLGGAEVLYYEQGPDQARLGLKLL